MQRRTTPRTSATGPASWSGSCSSVPNRPPSGRRCFCRGVCRTGSASSTSSISSSSSSAAAAAAALAFRWLGLVPPLLCFLRAGLRAGALAPFALSLREE